DDVPLGTASLQLPHSPAASSRSTVYRRSSAPSVEQPRMPRGSLLICSTRWMRPSTQISRATSWSTCRASSMSDRRLATLRTALGSLQLPPRATELQLLHCWLDAWTGVDLIAVGLHRQGWDLQLTQYGARTGVRRSTSRGPR